MTTTRQDVEQSLGTSVAKRLRTFGDGTTYVEASGVARLVSWLADFVFYLFCAAVGIVVFVLATRDRGLSDGVTTLSMLGILVGTPVLYGLFFGDGRGVGALVTGTRLVRVADGGRIGFSACWAMLVRTVLFPLLVLVLVLSEMVPLGAPRRTSIDDRATRRLRAVGLPRA